MTVIEVLPKTTMFTKWPDVSMYFIFTVQSFAVVFVLLFSVAELRVMLSK